MHTISRLRVKNAGVHRDREFNLTEGLNVLRGPNEGGKSTILECIAICFFGASAMRGGWEDIVTLGEKPTAMKLEMEFGPYTIKRSKASASVTSEDGTKISGHNDVTKFFLDMFGISKGTEKYVMVAEQSSIKGILEEGSAAATQFIEQLAGFEQIDQLVEQIKILYPADSIKVMQEQVEGLQLKKMDKLEEKNALPKQATLDMKVDECAEVVKEREEEISGVSKQIQTLENRITSIDGQLKVKFAKEKSLSEARDRVNFADQKILELDQEISSINPDPSEDVLAADKFLQNVDDAMETYRIWQWVTGLPKTEQVWDEGVETLAAFRAETEKTLAALSEQRKETSGWLVQLQNQTPSSPYLSNIVDDIAAIRADIRDVKGNYINDDICPTCKTNLSSEESRTQAAEINDNLDKRLELLEANLEAALTKKEDIEAELAERKKAQLKKVEQEIVAIDVAIASNEETLGVVKTIQLGQTHIDDTLEGFAADQFDLIDIDTSIIPNVVTWKGDAPVKPSQAEINKANDTITEFHADQASRKSLVNQKEQLCEQILNYKSLVEELEQEVKELPEIPEAAPLKEEVGVLQEKRSGMQENLKVWKERLAAANKAATANATVHEQLTKRILEIDEDIAAIRKKIDDSTDNNNFHKEVSIARTKVIDNVWANLLAHAGTCFSSIRGTESTIERENKNFVVDGLKVSRLSGSTLDSLGLALRAAIRDTFAPTANFMMLDELAAGMDPDRTAAAMAQVAALNVDQKILCTHEEISDALADNVVEV